MKHACPSCGQPISKKWLFFGAITQEYTCPYCNTRLKFTTIRYVMNFIVGILGALFLTYTGKETGFNWEWFVFYLPILLIFFVTAIWFTPGQYRIKKLGDFRDAKKEI